MIPKYSLPEIERRWLVDLSLMDFNSLPKPVTIVDRYLLGTRLRLRRMEGDGEVIYKFVKKYGRDGWTEPITNLYLSRAEYEMLSNLPATEIRKKRYRLREGSLDLIASPTGEICIFEAEFESVEKAKAFKPPPFVTHEIEGEPDYIKASSL